MSKQQFLIDNAPQILNWINESRPQEWIAKELKVSLATFKKAYPEYKGCKGTSFGAVVKKTSYLENPKYCLRCNKQLSYSQRKNSFCSTSCRSIIINARRCLLTPEEYEKQKTRRENRKNGISNRVYVCKSITERIHR